MSTPDASSPKRPSLLEKLDVIAKVFIGVGGLVLSAVIGLATMHYNREAARRQLESQQESLVLQRRSQAVQLLVSQFSTLVRGDERERAILLKILEQVQPEMVGEIGEVLFENADSGVAKQQARQIIASSREASREQRFSRHVEAAAKYRELGLFPAAAREYMRAAEVLPPQTLTAMAELESARQHYVNDEFEAAVRSFEKALRKASPRSTRTEERR